MKRNTFLMVIGLGISIYAIMANFILFCSIIIGLMVTCWFSSELLKDTNIENIEQIIGNENTLNDVFTIIVFSLLFFIFSTIYCNHLLTNLG